jgi:hypothetical protein
MMTEAARTAAPGSAAAVTAIAPLGPEFGYTIEKPVQSFYLGGALTGTYKEVTPPNVAKLEAHATNASLDREFRVKAVQTISTLSLYPPALASLERIATKDPALSRLVTKVAIAGLGNSQHPDAEAALKRISSSDQSLPFQRTAALAALKNIADTRPEPLGYW